ncbi:histidine biosynthesis trifunctional-protein [Auriscalpium vulgare]|uniref:Histidine biosynthesis trifunctional-protein n=1 Tax=Auriscalpium vulgare TaxID=40419 RepID=A0ACB8SAY6_9AGAM|nr:histidine biosynthesis trifunctional-protein [Auriscalpium vulgare]
MAVFLPLLDDADDALVSSLARIGPIVLPALPRLEDTAKRDLRHRYILVDHDTSVDQDDLVSWLDAGAEKIIVPLAWASELTGLIPPERLLLLLDVANASAVSEKTRSGVSGVLLRSPSLHLDLISSVAKFFSGASIYVLSSDRTTPPISSIRELHAIGASLVIPTSQLTLSPSTHSHINVADAFLAPVASDRPDGLFPTVVSSHPQGGRSLGIVYSSRESVAESITTGRGVYQSRKHGLWRKGETSGAVQDVVRIRLDCDADALEFSVIQHGAGFCHLNRPSCFGHLNGLSALESTLQSRLASAPEGSYTRRLFNDSDLLRSKIMEEADELCRAATKEDIAFEAADLLYFALTRCVAAGVSIADIEKSLDAKAFKVTRRTGNAKPQWSAQSAQLKASPTPPAPLGHPTPPAREIDLGPLIRMRTHNLASLTSTERNALLRRPVLKFDEMITKVAGCKEIVLATPPRPDGSISPEVMYVAHLVGASAVLKAGGGQAVAALAYGTQTVPKVDKIFGPGNQWVTAAKMLVQNDTDALVSIDMPAGPSEVLVIADSSCNDAFVAADLLSQAEHGVDSQVVLVAIDLDREKLKEIESELDYQARELERVDIVRQSIGKSIIVQVKTVAEALAFSNDYAPEHLILHIRNASSVIPEVQNAGSVFVGPFSPESCGDYASGTNHTLPTNGYARQFSGVNTLSFQKHITSQELTAAGLKELGPVVATLADCEGLQAHANAVRIRLSVMQ